MKTMTNEEICYHQDLKTLEEFVAICEKWAAAIKSACIKKAKQREKYYRNL